MNPIVLLYEVVACATCHFEHRGAKLGELRAVGNKNCVRCHAELASHTTKTQTKGTRQALTISSFELHPDFRSLDRDDGTVQFSHARHLATGLKLDVFLILVVATVD